MEEPSEVPVKETGKQSSEGSSPSCEQPGTSRDTVEPPGQNPSCEENEASLVPQPKKVSYSTELLSTWRDIRWFQVPLSSLRRPKTGLFSFRFQSSLQEYQQLRKTKRLKVGRPFSVFPFPSLSVTLSDCCQETLYKQHGKHSGTGRVKSCKSLTARQAAPAASVPARPQRHLQPHRQCLTILSITDTCDCENRHIATAQNPVVGARGGSCFGQPRVVLQRIHQMYWGCCHWNEMSPVPPGPRHRLQASNHCKRHRATALCASDVCGSENSSIAKAKITRASASRVNSIFPERVAPGPSSTQPRVLLRRVLLAQDGCETAAQGWDEARPHAHQLRTEEPTPMQPCVLLHRICLAQVSHERAPQDGGDCSPPDGQSQTEALMQPRVLLRRMPLARDQCKTALGDWDEPRPCDNQSCTKDLIPTQPRVVLHRVCLDQCRTTLEDKDGPRCQEHQSCTGLNPKQPRVLLHRVCLDQDEAAAEDREEPDSQSGAAKRIPMQPRVLLRRICPAQVQCETVPQDWDEPRPSSRQAEAEKLLAVSEELSASAHTGNDEAEPNGASPATEQPFSSPPTNQPPTALSPDHAKKAKLRRKGIQRHWRHSSSHLDLDNMSFSRQTCSRLQKCSSPACSPKRLLFCSGDAKRRQEGRTRRRFRKKQNQGALDRSEEGLTTDPPAHSYLLSPASSAVVMDMNESNEGTSEWSNADSPLEEDDDMFPADWTPPQVEFLYYDDPPSLSPAPGPASESQSSGEMPDITEEAFGRPVIEFKPKATSSTQGPLEILNQAAVTHTKNAALGETEKKDVAGLEHLETSLCQLADKELQGPMLVDQTRAKNWAAFGTACSPLPSPSHSSTTGSRISSRNSISMSSPDFSGDPDKLDLELDLMGEVDLEYPPSPYCYPPSRAPSRISSRSSMSVSSDDFVEDPEKQLLDSDRDLGLEASPSQLPIHPLLASSKISSRSSISASSDELVDDSAKMILDLGAERDQSLASPPSQLPMHPLLASSKISSRSSISPSSDELVDNSAKVILDLGAERDQSLASPPSQLPMHPLLASSKISSRSSISPSSDELVKDSAKVILDLGAERDQGLESPLSQLPMYSLLASSKIFFRSSISASSDELVEDSAKMILDLGAEIDQGLASPPQLPMHPLLASSKISSRSSISPSSDEFVDDSAKQILDSDVKRDRGPESPPLELSTHPLMMVSPTVSSRSSISISSHNLSRDPGLDMEEDMDDSGLISLRDLLQTDDTNQNSVELSTILSEGPDCYLSSLDKLLEEKREQIREDAELERSLGEKLLLSRSHHSVEAVEENAVTFPEAHRLLLKQFSINQGAIPAVHPGEIIFGPLPYLKTVLALDTAGLMPQNQLESLFFSSQFDQQMALLKDGFLTFLYCGSSSRCPCPVRRWLFQLMSLNSEVSTDAFQALWEITTHQVASNDEVITDLWFPTLKDITQAFCHLGACAFAMYPVGLVQLEFRPKGLEFSEHLLECDKLKSQSLLQESSGQHTLVSMLGDIFKFLTLCVASHPHSYPDHQRLAFLAVLCRLSLDRSLQKQPLLELQQLLLVLLEGIGDWQEKLLELCKSLCHVSQHHHNLVAIVHLFPDTTDRGRQLRRNLSLSFITKLLGKMHMAESPWQEEIQRLGHLLPLMKPAFLKQNLQRLQKYQDGNEQQEALVELDQEACYLCYSLLTLAGVVVGTQAMPSSKQGPLQHLCIQLQQHIGASIREDPCTIYRTELKNLVAQTYVKWQELLSQSWLQVVSYRATVDGTHPRDTALL